MELDHMWTALIALILGITFGMAFYNPLSVMLGIADTTAKIFLGVIISIVIFLIIVWMPIGSIIQDDRGKSS